MGIDDRRKFGRKNKQSVISFYVVDDSGGKNRLSGQVIDGSKGGIRFKSQKPLTKNTKIYIKLDSEEWGEELTYFCRNMKLDLIEVIGSVMWCLEDKNHPGEFEVGTRFLGQVEQ